MSTLQQPELTEDDCLRKLGQQRHEVLLPGYWKSIADNCTCWADEISAGPYWAEVKKRLSQWRTEYRSANKSDLLTQLEVPQFVSKEEQSIRGKLFRYCKGNGPSDFKAFLPDGPPIPQISDLVRTRIACRYIDGVEFLATKMLDLSQELSIQAHRDREGTINGYFAQHITIFQPVIHRTAGYQTLVQIRCEIQIASEMATRMWDAAHPLYESVRGEHASPEDWQWKPDDPRFISNQLGHMIHLADGLLVQLRKATVKRD